jgi:thiol-disulfide isomerase/thioredoxin
MSNKNQIFFLLIVFLSTSLLAITDFSLKKIDGSTYKLSESIGKRVIIIDFWATWCKPCKKLLKRLQKIDKKYKNKVKIIAISIDSTSALSKVESYIKGRKISFDVLLDTERKVANLLNPSGNVPFTLIINKKGKLVYTHAGFMIGFEKILEKKLDKLLKE